ncbi:MAG TPA: peptidase M36, partial [Actinophytocola sp.]|nr:peptidase M36 [Actinophytocola sp.]
MAQPAPAAGPASHVQGDVSTSQDIDNRGAAAAPSAQARTTTAERSIAVRWNLYGTPATLVPRTDIAPRAAAGADPVAIARGFLATNRTAFGLSDHSINEMDVLVNRPMGEGSYVMLRQRFGSLPSALDGLAAFGIRDGAVVYLTSTISPNQAAPEPATLSAEQALAAAAADAGLALDAVGTSRVQPGAVPMPGAAARSAYQVVLLGKDQADLTGFTTYIDGRTGKVLFREDIVDHDVDNPEWDVFPANPPA